MSFRSYGSDLIRGHSCRLRDLLQRQEAGGGELPHDVRPTLCLAQRAPPFKPLFKSLFKSLLAPLLKPLFKPFLAPLLKPLFVAFGKALIAGILEESPPIPLRLPKLRRCRTDPFDRRSVPSDRMKSLEIPIEGSPRKRYSIRDSDVINSVC